MSRPRTTLLDLPPEVLSRIAQEMCEREEFFMTGGLGTRGDWSCSHNLLKLRHIHPKLTTAVNRYLFSLLNVQLHALNLPKLQELRRMIGASPVGDLSIFIYCASALRRASWAANDECTICDHVALVDAASQLLEQTKGKLDSLLVSLHGDFRHTFIKVPQLNALTTLDIAWVPFKTIRDIITASPNLKCVMFSERCWSATDFFEDSQPCPPVVLDVVRIYQEGSIDDWQPCFRLLNDLDLRPRQLSIDIGFDTLSRLLDALEVSKMLQEGGLKSLSGVGPEYCDSYDPAALQAFCERYSLEVVPSTWF